MSESRARRQPAISDGSERDTSHFLALWEKDSGNPKGFNANSRGCQPTVSTAKPGDPGRVEPAAGPSRSAPLARTNHKLPGAILRRQFVAQVSNLLYRRIPFGRPSVVETVRRLEICDTAGWKPALRAFGSRLRRGVCDLSGLKRFTARPQRSAARRTAFFSGGAVSAKVFAGSSRSIRGAAPRMTSL